MKIAYIYTALLSVGGADRVITEKANFLAENSGHEVFIITDSQINLPPVFPISPKVRHIDLNVNFDQQYRRGLVLRLYYYIKLMHEYKKKLTNLLFQIRADIVITTLGRDLDFLTQIKDGSKKIGESHIAKYYTRNFHLMEQRGFLYAQIAHYWRKKQEKSVRKLDSLVVLTQYDANSWKSIKKTTIIPNSLPFYPAETSTCENKQIITVGRLSEQKGYDKLISAWAKIASKYPDWHIDLYGEGELEYELKKQISKENVENSFFIHKPVSNIQNKYIESSIYIMSSRFEGFGMVLIEAMACGVPCISFDCPHGPSYIIKDQEDGILVENGNIEKLAKAISLLIENGVLRKQFGKQAKLNVQRYSPVNIMKQWEILFNNLKNNNIDKK